ncbi:MAG: hypothetical protein SCH39_13120 [Methanosarcinales archaeon]|nr:hypothetical protein [Methanosarcinales archaeon]
MQSFPSNLTTFAGLYRTSTNTTLAPLAYPLSHARTHEHTIAYKSINVGPPDKCGRGSGRKENGGRLGGALDVVSVER